MAADPARPVSIVIATTGDLGLLWRTLDSLVRVTAEQLFEVVVVACGLDAATEQFLGGLEGDVTVVREPAGTGPAAARNAGAAKAGGDHLVFLEPGTQLTPLWRRGPAAGRLAGRVEALVRRPARHLPAGRQGTVRPGGRLPGRRGRHGARARAA
jgi:hypothetical protein